MAILRELALDTDGDLLIQNGQLVFLTGAAAVAQRIQTRLRSLLGDWVFDRNVGTPWLERILTGEPRLDIARGILAQRIRDSQGVSRLLSLDLSVDRATRVLTVDFRAVTTDGEVSGAVGVP